MFTGIAKKNPFYPMQHPFYIYGVDDFPVLRWDGRQFHCPETRGSGRTDERVAAFVALLGVTWLQRVFGV